MSNLFLKTCVKYELYIHLALSMDLYCIFHVEFLRTSSVDVDSAFAGGLANDGCSDALPDSAMVDSSSARTVSNTLHAPSSPPQARPHTSGRPMNTCEGGGGGCSWDVVKSMPC